MLESSAATIGGARITVTAGDDLYLLVIAAADPEIRSLLRSAKETFSTMMSYLVEAGRDFIRANSLRA